MAHPMMHGPPERRVGRRVRPIDPVRLVWYPQGMATISVGVVANPASGRDVRRLVTGASVFDNAEKGAMVHRLMAGSAPPGWTGWS
jgi:hypothetical protein